MVDFVVILELDRPKSSFPFIELKRVATFCVQQKKESQMCLEQHEGE